MSSESASRPPPTTEAAEPSPPLRQSRSARTWKPDWIVTDDLPRPVPVCRAELEVVETYLGAALDELMRRMAR